MTAESIALGKITPPTHRRPGLVPGLPDILEAIARDGPRRPLAGVKSTKTVRRPAAEPVVTMVR
jgi:hypothetical protein